MNEHVNMKSDKPFVNIQGELLKDFFTEVLKQFSEELFGSLLRQAFSGGDA